MDSTPWPGPIPALDGASPRTAFTPSPWISAAAFRSLRANPGLPAAVSAFALSLIQLYRGNALLNALLCDRGRILVGFFVLYLELHPLPGANERGATLSAVQALCRRTKLCSAGRAASVLAAMRFGGYFTPKLDPNDHRRRILVPAHKLIAAHHQHWVRQFEAMATIFPEAALVPAQLEIPSFRAAFLRHLGAYFLAGFRVLDHVLVLAGLAESNAGLLLLSSLAVPQLAGAARPGDHLLISISALSRGFCVSRAHVRNLLAAAEREGLLARGPGPDDVLVLPELPEALIQFYGVLFLFFHRCAVSAAGDVHGNADPLN